MTRQVPSFVPNRAGAVLQKRGAWPKSPAVGAGWAGRWSGHLSCVGGAQVESGLVVVIVQSADATLRLTQPAWNGAPFFPELVPSPTDPAVAAGASSAEVTAVLAGDQLVIGRVVQLAAPRFEGHVGEAIPPVECVAVMSRQP